MASIDVVLPNNGTPPLPPPPPPPPLSVGPEADNEFCLDTEREALEGLVVPPALLREVHEVAESPEGPP